MNQKVFLISRILLGLIFLVFGSNGLMMVLTGHGFIPMPPPKPEVMEKMQGLMAVGYLMPLVKSLQIISGILLLSGKFINLAITLLSPIVVNILAVHIFIDLSGLPLAVIITALMFVLIKGRWTYFKPLLLK